MGPDPYRRVVRVERDGVTLHVVRADGRGHAELVNRAAVRVVADGAQCHAGIVGCTVELIGAGA